MKTNLNIYLAAVDDEHRKAEWTLFKHLSNYLDHDCGKLTLKSKPQFEPIGEALLVPRRARSFSKGMTLYRAPEVSVEIEGDNPLRPIYLLSHYAGEAVFIDEPCLDQRQLAGYYGDLLDWERVIFWLRRGPLTLDDLADRLKVTRPEALYYMYTFDSAEGIVPQEAFCTMHKMQQQGTEKLSDIQLHYYALKSWAASRSLAECTGEGWIRDYLTLEPDRFAEKLKAAQDRDEGKRDRNCPDSPIYYAEDLEGMAQIFSKKLLWLSKRPQTRPEQIDEYAGYITTLENCAASIRSVPEKVWIMLNNKDHESVESYQ